MQIDLITEQEQVLELFKTIRNLTEGKKWKYSKTTVINDGRLIIHLKVEKNI